MKITPDIRLGKERYVGIKGSLPWEVIPRFWGWIKRKWSDAGEGGPSLPTGEHVPLPSPPPIMRSRQLSGVELARWIYEFEARKGSDGRLKVYRLPSNDGGGSFEVAGINNRYHPAVAWRLRQLLEEGKHAAAEKEAIAYIESYTARVAAWGCPSQGVEFFLRDCAFNRGPTGAAKILQMALVVPDDGIVGPRTKAALAAATPKDLLGRLRREREVYERKVAGYRENLWRGLVRRWERAHGIALEIDERTVA